MDSSWDNSGKPEAPRGLSLWAKLGIGCGVLILLWTGSCVAIGVYASRHGGDFEKKVEGWISKSIAEEWAICRTTVERLRTDESAGALYRENPALVRDYPTGEAFLEAVRRWRPRLDPLPEAPALTGDSHDLRISKKLGGYVEIRYRNAQGATLHLELDHGRIRSLDVR